MMYSSSRLAVLAAACFAVTCQAVELFQVTTHLDNKETDKLEEMKFSICLNEDVINAVADQFIEYSGTLSPEDSSFSGQLKSLKDLVCNEHTEKLHPTMCKSNTPLKFIDPVNPFSAVTLSNETFRISAREGQTAAGLTDCFCSKHMCSYHQGKHIEEALSLKIAKAEANKNPNEDKEKDKEINIKISSSSSSASSQSKKSNSKK